MAQGIGLAGGFGAGGVKDALVDLIAQRMAQAEFDEKRRQAANAETLARETLGQRKTESSMEDARAKAGLRENQRQFGETLGLNVKKLGEDTRQFDTKLGEDQRQFDTGHQFRQGESVRDQGNKDRSFGLDELTVKESGRHHRAMEGAAAQRITSGRGATKIVQGTDEQGRPASFLIDQEGNIVKSFGKPLSNVERTQQIDADAAAKSVGDIETLFKDEYVGPIQGRLGKASSATGIGLTPERAEFSAAVAHMKNAIIKEITGAAVGVQEEGRIMGEIPDVTDPPETFRAKLATTKRNREYLQSRIAERTGGTPAASGGDPGKGQQFDFDPASGKLVPRGGR
jgi:hypothetical protein